MNTPRIRTACTLLALAAAIGLTAIAGAQYGGPGGGGGRGGMGGMAGSKGGPPQDGMQRGGPPQETPLNSGALVQVELDKLEDQLRLTAAQLDAWRLYADKVQKLADDIARSRFDARAAVPASANAVQQLEQIASVSGMRATALDDIVVAGRALYARLNEEQKAIVDRRLWLPVSLLATGVMPPGMSDTVTRGSRRPSL